MTTKALTQTETAFDQITEGDRVQVHIESPANPFGNTQMATFDVTEVNPGEGTIFGHDDDWGDETELLGGGGTFHYADGGKSGDVVTIEIMDTNDDGVTIHGSGTVVYEQ